MSSDRIRMPRIKGNIDFKSAWPKILLGTLYLFILLINGLDEFLRSGFDINLLFTPEWFYSVFRVLLSNMLIFLGTFMFLLNEALKKDPDILAKKKQVNKAVDEHLDPVTFDPFYGDFEKQRKVKFYKRSMEVKLEKLENKATLKDIALWRKQEKNYDKDGNIIDDKVNQEFENSKFCKKKSMILSQLDPDFIDQHIEYMKVPYKPNSKSFITNGYNKPSNRYDEYTVESGLKKIMYDLAFKFILAAGILIATESVLVEVDIRDTWGEVIYNMILKIMPLLMQIYFAIAYRDAYIADKVMVDLRKRYDILTLYVASIGKGVENNA